MMTIILLSNVCFLLFLKVDLVKPLPLLFEVCALFSLNSTFKTWLSHYKYNSVVATDYHDDDYIYNHDNLLLNYVVSFFCLSIED